MKVVLLMGALCGNFYQNSAIAKDQDGIVMFGGGNLGCAKNPVVQTKNNEWHVKCGLGNNVIVDLTRKTTISCMGYFEGNWKITEGQIIYKNKNINNDHFICYRYAYNPAFGLDRVATSDVSSHSYSQNLNPMLVTYDVLSATVHVCIVPYYDEFVTVLFEGVQPILVLAIPRATPIACANACDVEAATVPAAAKNSRRSMVFSLGFEPPRRGR